MGLQHCSGQTCSGEVDDDLHEDSSDDDDYDNGFDISILKGDIYIYILTMMIFPGHADNIHKLTIARLDSGDAAILVTASGARTFTLKVFYHCHHYCHRQQHCHYHYYFTIMTKIIIVIITKIMTQITIVTMKKIMTIMLITIAIMIIMTIRARLPA